MCVGENWRVGFPFLKLYRKKGEREEEEEKKKKKKKGGGGSYLLELYLQFLALLSHLQELSHDLVLLLPSLLEIGCKLGDDAVPLFQSRFKVLQLRKMKDYSLKSP